MIRTFPLPLRAVLQGLAVLTLAACVAAVVGATLLYLRQPDLTALIDYRPKQPLRVYTADGVEIGQFGSERRYLVPIADIPKRMQDAVLAVEDVRFREHIGVDARGVVRAFLTNLWRARRSQGASTITQQVARTFYLSSRKSYMRKINEMLLAVKIERQLGKDQVLGLYMNQIFLGHRAYGFEAAAQTYFGKPMSALNLAETAMLAGLPQNPVHANPITNLARARHRQRQVLDRMVAAGMVTAGEAGAAGETVLQVRTRVETPLHAEHVAEMARQAVYARFGEAAYTRGLTVVTTLRARDQQAAWRALRRGLLAYDRRRAWRGPEDHEDLPEGAPDEAVARLLADHRDDEDLRVAVVTAAAPDRVVATLATGEVVELRGEALRGVQAALSRRPPADLAIRRGAVLRLAQDTPGGPWSVRQWPEVEGAFVAVEPDTGHLRALVGGFDFQRNQFNHASNAWRQPGSTYKPFLYSAALEQGVMPATLVNDAPLVLPDDIASSGWNPQNADGTFDGPVTLRTALARSKNLVSIRLAKLVGVDAARDWTARFGFDPARQPDNLTLALGAGETTPLQLAAAYGTFANGGHRVTPVFIQRVTDARGEVLYDASPAADGDGDGDGDDVDNGNGNGKGDGIGIGERVIPERNAFLIGSLLNEVTRTGSASRVQAELQRPDLYGKTGTTNDAVDAWFAGYQPTLAAVAWVGHDAPRSLGPRAFGATLAMPVWIDFMRTALADEPVSVPVAPDDVMQVEGDWTYIEWTFGGARTHIGFDDATEALDGPAAAAPPRPPLPLPRVPTPPPLVPPPPPPVHEPVPMGPS